MGAIVNGLVPARLRAPSASTFFIFSDYMKASVRLAALMRAPVDLRVHARLDRRRRGRARPTSRSSSSPRCGPCRTSTCVRPGGRERDRAGVAVRARARPTRPTALALTRQGVAVLEPGRHPGRRDRARRLRAARLRERRARPDPDRHGHRGPHRHRRRGAARGGGHRDARGVACRAWTASPSRTRTTATSVLPPAVRARVSVEAATTLGWAPGSARTARSIGMTDFGASAPQQDAVRALRLHRRERRRARRAC